MKLKSLLTVTMLAVFALGASAQIEVKNVWARATVKGQMATGVFMRVTAKDAALLVGGSSPVAGVTQVHEMKMEGSVMKMAEVKGGSGAGAGRWQDG